MQFAGPSIFVPHILNRVSKEHIFNTFQNLNWGDVCRVDIIRMKKQPNKPRIKQAFVHFYQWYDCVNAINTRAMFLSGEEVRVVWNKRGGYWKTKRSTSLPGHSPTPFAGVLPVIQENEFEEHPRPDSPIPPSPMIAFEVINEEPPFYSPPVQGTRFIDTPQPPNAPKKPISPILTNQENDIWSPASGWLCNVQ